MRLPTPCANSPNSFAAASFQIVKVLASLMRWRYSILAPVYSLMTEVAICLDIVRRGANTRGRKTRGRRVWARWAACWRARVRVLYRGMVGLLCSSSNVLNKCVTGRWMRSNGNDGGWWQWCVHPRRCYITGVQSRCHPRI
jgi:hypothetical protein